MFLAFNLVCLGLGILPIRESLCFMSSQTFLTAISKSSVSTGNTCHSVSLMPMEEEEIGSSQAIIFLTIL
jgi:hypothetical protein